MFAITERLLLRPGWREDAPALARAIGHKAIVGNLARAPWPYTLGDAEAFLAAPRADPRCPDFLIFRRGTNALLGGIGITAGDTPELGYWIARDHWGRGFATEAGRAVLALADHSLRLPRLAAAYAIDNPASGAVLRKLGFGPPGRRRPIAPGLLVRERAVAAHVEEPAPLAA